MWCKTRESQTYRILFSPNNPLLTHISYCLGSCALTCENGTPSLLSESECWHRPIVKLGSENKQHVHWQKHVVLTIWATFVQNYVPFALNCKHITPWPTYNCLTEYVGYINGSNPSYSAAYEGFVLLNSWMFFSCHIYVFMGIFYLAVCMTLSAVDVYRCVSLHRSRGCSTMVLFSNRGRATLV